MNKRTNQKRRSNTRIETIIIILIALCMIFLIDFNHDKLNDFARLEQEALLINHDPANPIHQQLAEEIIQYRPGAYKMIEIYSPNFELLMTLQFMKKSNYETNLASHPELVELFYTNDEGHTELTIDDNKEDIYFKWTEGTNKEKYLVVIYSSRKPVKNLWVFSFVCYIVLLLIFFLLLRLHMRNYIDRVRQYQSTSDEIRNRLRR